MGALPYKTNGSHIRWEPYHIKQMGAISDGSPTMRKRRDCAMQIIAQFFKAGNGNISYKINYQEGLNGFVRFLPYRFEICP